MDEPTAINLACKIALLNPEKNWNNHSTLIGHRRVNKQLFYCSLNICKFWDTQYSNCKINDSKYHVMSIKVSWLHVYYFRASLQTSTERSENKCIN